MTTPRADGGEGDDTRLSFHQGAQHIEASFASFVLRRLYLTRKRGHYATGNVAQCPHVADLAAGEGHGRLADLDLVPFAEAVFVDALAVHRGAIRAVFVAQNVAALIITIDGGVQARDGEVFQEDIAFAAAPNAQAIFAQFIGAPWLLAFADDDIGHTRFGARTRGHWGLLGRRAPPLLLGTWAALRRGATPALILRRRATPAGLLGTRARPTGLRWHAPALILLRRRTAPTRLLLRAGPRTDRLWWRAPPLILLWRRATPALVLLRHGTTPPWILLGAGTRTALLRWRRAPALILQRIAPAGLRIGCRGTTARLGLRGGATPALVRLHGRRATPTLILLWRGTWAALLRRRRAPTGLLITPPWLRRTLRVGPAIRVRGLARSATLLRRRAAPALLWRHWCLLGIRARGRAPPLILLRIAPAAVLLPWSWGWLVAPAAAATPIKRGRHWLVGCPTPATANGAAKVAGAMHCVAAHVAAGCGRTPIGIAHPISSVTHGSNPSCGAFIQLVGEAARNLTAATIAAQHHDRDDHDSQHHDHRGDNDDQF